MPTISPLELAKKQTAKSGNRFHARIKAVLNEKGWETVVSPYYVDVVTGQPREVDLIAWKDFQIPQIPRSPGIIRVFLYIDCKWLTQGELFWLDKIDNVRRNDLLVSVFQYDAPHYSQATINRNHHYLPANNLVAKLYEVIGTDQTSDRDPIYKGVTQAIHSSIYYSSNPSVLSSGGMGPDILYAFPYMAVVCQSFDGVFATCFDQPDNIIEYKDEPYLLTEVSYAYSQPNGVRNKYALVDIVNGKRITEWLTIIESDVKDVSQIISVKLDRARDD